MDSTTTTDEPTVEISFSISEKTLALMDDETIEKAGTLYAAALKRRRGELHCERDGHIEMQIPYRKGVCERCFYVMNERLWEWVKKGGEGDPPA